MQGQCMGGGGGSGTAQYLVCESLMREGEKKRQCQSYFGIVAGLCKTGDGENVEVLRKIFHLCT